MQLFLTITMLAHLQHQQICRNGFSKDLFRPVGFSTIWRINFSKQLSLHPLLPLWLQLLELLTSFFSLSICFCWIRLKRVYSSIPNYHDILNACKLLVFLLSPQSWLSKKLLVWVDLKSEIYYWIEKWNVVHFSLLLMWCT